MKRGGKYGGRESGPQSFSRSPGLVPGFSKANLHYLLCTLTIQPLKCPSAKPPPWKHCWVITADVLYVTCSILSWWRNLFQMISSQCINLLQPLTWLKCVLRADAVLEVSHIHMKYSGASSVMTLIVISVSVIKFQISKILEPFLFFSPNFLGEAPLSKLSWLHTFFLTYLIFFSQPGLADSAFALDAALSTHKPL